MYIKVVTSGLVPMLVLRELNTPRYSGTSLISDQCSVGALGFGLLVDIIGRRWAFNLTCLITSVFGLILVRSALALPRYTRLIPPSCSRLHLNTITVQSVVSTFLPRLALEATSPSTQPLPLSFFPRTAGTSSSCYRSGSLSGLLSRRQLPTALLRNGGATLPCPLVMPLNQVQHAAQFLATWVGDMRL